MINSLLTSRLTDKAAIPEMALSLACARSNFDPAAPQTIGQLLKGPIQWPRFLELASEHGLLNCVYPVLASQTNAVPDEIRTTLRTDSLHFSMRAMQFSAELMRLTEHLSTTGIKVIAYKGPVLAQTLYGSTGKRHFNDLDLLVDESDLSSVRANLLSLGYRSGNEWEWEVSFVRDDTKISVDVHWAFAHQSLRLNLPFDGVWERRRIVTIGGTSVTTLGNEDTLIVQCINAAKDDWSSLGQLFEIGLIASRYQIDWPNLVERAESAGCRRVVLIGLSLASQFFAAPIPLAATVILKGDRSVQQLSSEIAAELIQANEMSGKVMCLNRLRARSRERLRERLPHYRRMLKHTLMPNEKDFELLPLPKLLFPLYFVIRPIRLLHKYRATILPSRAKNTARKTDTISD